MAPRLIDATADLASAVARGDATAAGALYALDAKLLIPEQLLRAELLLRPGPARSRCQLTLAANARKALKKSG